VNDRFTDSFKLKRPILAVMTVTALLGLVGFTIAAFRTNSSQDRPDDASRKILKLQYERGVVAQVKLAQPGDSATAIAQAVDSVASFIEKRSGLSLSDHAKKRLAKLEAQALADSKQRITSEELVEIMTSTASERLASLRDDEIASIRATMKNRAFSDDDDPRGISLRGSGGGGMSPNEFTNIVTEARGSAQGGDAMFRWTLRKIISGEISKNLILLNEYAASHFGGTPRNGMTPLQATLIVYSLLSDDSLVHSDETLRAQMMAVRAAAPSLDDGQPLVHAYGSHGYRYATALDVLLDEKTLDRIVNRFESQLREAK
jgi:hypothetical protein